MVVPERHVVEVIWAKSMIVLPLVDATGLVHVPLAKSAQW
jgi:hypothetical protein